MARKKEKEKGIKLIHIILIIAIIVIGIFVSKKFMKNEQETEKNSVEQEQQSQSQEKFIKIYSDGVKLNTSAKLNEEKQWEDLKIKDVQLTYRNGVTNLLCNIENTSNKNLEMQDVEISLLDENGEIIYNMTGIIEDINAGETKQFNSSVTADFSNAYDFKINKK